MQMQVVTATMLLHSTQLAIQHLLVLLSAQLLRPTLQAVSRSSQLVLEATSRSSNSLLRAMRSLPAQATHRGDIRMCHRQQQACSGITAWSPLPSKRDQQVRALPRLLPTGRVSNSWATARQPLLLRLQPVHSSWTGPPGSPRMGNQGPQGQLMKQQLLLQQQSTVLVMEQGTLLLLLLAAPQQHLSELNRLAGRLSRLCSSMECCNWAMMPHSSHPACLQAPRTPRLQALQQLATVRNSSRCEAMLRRPMQLSLLLHRYLVRLCQQQQGLLGLVLLQAAVCRQVCKLGRSSSRATRDLLVAAKASSSSSSRYSLGHQAAALAVSGTWGLFWTAGAAISLSRLATCLMWLSLR